MPYVILLTAIILIPVIWWIAAGNKFRRLLVKAEEAGSGIDVALTKRYDTLTKLLSITKAYAGHESDTFEKIIRLRQGMTVTERKEANAQLDQFKSEISLLAENYPELKSSENYRQLQIAVSDVEEHLQAARRLFNSNVSLLNQKIVTFPDSLVARAMGLQRQEFFETEESKKADVQMAF